MQIEYRLEPVDLAGIRFVQSPIWELVTSFRALADPRAPVAHRGWIESRRRAVQRLRLRHLPALVARPGGPPDFLTPTPLSRHATIDAELDAVRATEPDRVPGGFVGVLEEVVDELESYWEAVVAPVWPRLRALGLADVAHRLEQFVDGGIEAVLANLHPRVGYADDRVLLRGDPDTPLPRGRQSFLLLPCGFLRPDAVLARACDHYPVLAYPPHGGERLGNLHTEPGDPGRLGAVFGRTRAVLLDILELPHTTTELARRLDLAPAAISQHLSALRAAKLVQRRRRGREVYYHRTEAAAALVASSRSFGPL